MGNLDNPVQVNPQHLHLAAYLASEGVLYPGQKPSTFRMMSPIIDSLIRQVVILHVYPTCPTMLVPVKSKKGPLDILKVLKQALQYFDKNLICQSPECSSKGSRVCVGGDTRASVPR